jgi:hypothetical protein
MTSAADHPPSQKTTAVLTAVLRACAEHVAQRADLPAILEASRLAVPASSGVVCWWRRETPREVPA